MWVGEKYMQVQVGTGEELKWDGGSGLLGLSQIGISQRQHYPCGSVILACRSDVYLCLSAEIDARPWDFQAEECALRVNIETFNSRRYGLYHSDLEFAPVDNCLQSVLGRRLPLPEDFRYSYELWLEREVFAQPIRWEDLLQPLA